MFLLGFVIVLFGGLVLMFAVLSRNQEALRKTMREDHDHFDSRLRQLEALVNFCAKTARQGMNNTETENRDTLSRGTLSDLTGYSGTAPLGSTRPTYGELSTEYTADSLSRQPDLQLDLPSDRPSPRASGHQKESGMPDLKF